MGIIGYMRVTIDANDLHLTDKLLIQDVETRQDVEIDLESVDKKKDEKTVIVESNIGVFRFRWFETILINRPVWKE